VTSTCKKIRVFHRQRLYAHVVVVNHPKKWYAGVQRGGWVTHNPAIRTVIELKDSVPEYGEVSGSKPVEILQDEEICCEYFALGFGGCF